MHQDEAGNLAVVGLLFRQGDPSPLVQALLDAAPAAGVSEALSGGPDASDYVPNTLGYFGYDGSLTTPPCTEGVRWIVMQSVGTVSQEQTRQLRKLTPWAQQPPRATHRQPHHNSLRCAVMLDAHNLLRQRPLKWSGRWESNPRSQLGRLGLYH